MVFKTAPLPASVMVIGIVGFFFSVIFWNSGKLSHPWGFTFTLVSVILIVASLRSLGESIKLVKKKK